MPRNFTVTPAVGARFGKWEVIACQDKEKLECRCDCGRVRLVGSWQLTRGKSGSCIHCRPLSTHGKHNTREYRAWHNMKQRCLNPRHPSYPNYGGRGIKVCAAWLSFEGFWADMGDRPSDDLSIDRIDNGGDYEPENCRWAVWVDQCDNKRQSHLITHDGLTLSVTGWAKRLGMSYATLERRLRSGWSVERSLTEPVNLAMKRR